MRLDELALKYKADKSSACHDYCPAYEELLPDREAVRKVVEIGVWKGASLRMWAEWFPNAEVWGIEIPPVDAGPLPDRVHVLLGSVLYADLSPIGDYVDLIVDDGSHRAGDVLGALGRLLPRLGPGGVYTIEDMFGDNAAPEPSPGEVLGAVARFRGLRFFRRGDMLVVQ